MLCSGPLVMYEAHSFVVVVHGDDFISIVQGSHLREKRAGYANLKMPCVYCTQKTVTSHIKMRLVFSFFTPSREGL